MTEVCNICGSADVKKTLDLPDYPINGLYIPKFSANKKYVSDFEMYQCKSCYHLQGVSKMPVDAFYNNEYSYNPGTTGVQGRVNMMTGRILEYAKGKSFNRIIEVGCNDLSLLKNLKEKGLVVNHWIGIDPVPLKAEDQVEGILFMQGYVQDIEIPFGNNDLPDLIVSDQVFEHIPRTNEVLAALSKAIASDSSFIVCVPSIELLVGNYSYHYIIHEHLNYFSEGSLANLFCNCNFKLEHSELINELTDGYLLQIYTNPKSHKGSSPIKAIDFLPKFERNYAIYLRTLELVKDILHNNIDGKIYGFGGSHITGNFAYFMQSDLAPLDFIIDDTPYRQNMFIPNIKPQITGTSEISNMADSTIMVTAPQADRPILNRLLALKPKKIINPLNVF